MVIMGGKGDFVWTRSEMFKMKMPACCLAAAAYQDPLMSVQLPFPVTTRL